MDSSPTTNWLELVEKLQQGDRLALLKITRVITGYLSRYQAYDIRDAWDDLCQDVLMALIKSVEANKIQHEQAFVAYLGAITRNKLSDWINRKVRAGSDRFLGDPDTTLAVLDRIHRDDSHQQQDDLLDLAQALDSLPERERQVVTAIYIEGRSYDEAADGLGLALGTLKRLQTRGLKLLRRKMHIDPAVSKTGGSDKTVTSSPENTLRPQPDTG